MNTPRPQVSLKQIATCAGLTLAAAVLVFLAGISLDSLSLVLAATALALPAVVALALAASWSAWRTLSWLSLLLAVCPVAAFVLTLWLDANGSGLSWLGTYLGLTATLALGVGLTASRSPSVLARVVALGVATSGLFGFILVLVLVLAWHGDLN